MVVRIVLAAAPSATEQLVAIINRATGWLVGIAFVIATFYATVAGLRRLLAGDDPAQMEGSRKALRNALVGYGIAVLAPVLVGIAKSILGV